MADRRQRRAGRSARTARFTRGVAPGIHRLEHAHTNCYLVEDGDSLTLVDAAFPATWQPLLRALRALGRSPRNVRALVLTHAHFDHLGMARRIAREWEIPVFGHAADEYIARHPYRYLHERARWSYPIRHPRSIAVLGRMTAAGALSVPGIDALTAFPLPAIEPVELAAPGAPTLLETPGHTAGSSALWFADRSTVLVGDALVTFDPYTGGEGPQVVSGAATADSAQALASLDVLDATDARLVLPGHGATWRSGIRAATQLARAAGPS